MEKDKVNLSLQYGQLQKGILSQVVKDLTNFKKSPKERRTASYASSRLAMLDENLRIARQYHEAIIGAGRLEEELKSEELIVVYEQITEIGLEYRVELMEALDKCPKASTSTEISTPAPLAATSGPSARSGHELRLPKIDIPKFNGSYTNWRAFHDLFQSLVHKNSALNEVEKLHYLKSCLQGEAERLLQHLPSDAGNYEKAWSLLISRYDHKRVLVNAQLKVFFSQDSLLKESVMGLKGLLDTSQECIHALGNLDLPVEHWDTILIYILFQKLPSTSQQLWEEKLGNSKELPTFAHFTEFLETRFRTLEAVDQQDPKTGGRLRVESTVNNRQRFNTESYKTHHTKTTTKDANFCKLCHQGQHSIRKCQQFLNMDNTQRKQTVRRLRVCDNCLAYNHFVRECPSTKCCYFCQQRHHSLLHSNMQGNVYQREVQTIPSSSTQPQRSTSSHTYQVSINPKASEFQPIGGAQPSVASTTLNNFHTSSDGSRAQVLLATAVVNVKSADGRFQNLRALIDPGSEASFISEKAVQLLHLKKHRAFVEVSGLGLVSSGTTRNYVNIVFSSRHSAYEGAVTALVFKSLTGLLPARRVMPERWQHLSGLKLADPNFYVPAEVDLLLGSDVYAEILLPEIIRSGDLIAPVAQKTHLGWVVFGKAPEEGLQRIHSFAQFLDLDAQLQRFWEMEETPFESQGKVEDIACDNHFVENTNRLTCGRYEVRLPFKEMCYPALGSSRNCALRRFASLEKRFASDPKLHEDYTQCMREYISLRHMSEIDLCTDEVLRSPFHYFLPHHAVFKEASSTSKLRVVFDAAAKSSDGSSLNDHLLVGPKLQTNIMDILLKWRTYRVTFTADIEKMYRQILVSASDRYYQLIFWREKKTDPLKAYTMNTVTFGTASAPYLAIRVLKRVAEEEACNYPVGAKVVSEDMYVDDLISGADSIEEAIHKRDQARQMLASAGFNLRKWTSNDRALVQDIQPKDREYDFELPFSESSHIKTLGIRWFPMNDCFSFFNFQVEAKQTTKRSMLSIIAKLFDPMGWIAPCVITAKIMMQKLWCLGSDWDDHVPDDLRKEWEVFLRELPRLEKVKIPRWMRISPSNESVELHGFCDASMRAFGAVVYLRVDDEQSKVHMNIVLSKTRVAPIKRTTTLPRLELCGAVVLASLLRYTADILAVPLSKTYAWTDSTITLAWIKATPSKWVTFVSNRVSEIQRLVGTDPWRHVPTQHNPADFASRGVLPSALESLEMWWNGPSFLRQQWEFETPEQPMNINVQEEERTVKVHCTRADNECIISGIIHKFSQLLKVIRIIAFCIRFVGNCRSGKARKLGPLTAHELQAATLCAVKVAQKEMFPLELKEAQRNGKIPKSLKVLNVFVDAQGILRVGGRLQNALLTYEEKHPIILSHNHHFTRLIIQDAHSRTFHGGIQQVMAFIRRKYWIGQLKRTVKYHLHKCTICFRQRAKAMSQLMGSLPAARVRMARPFSYTGVDYAGPIEVKSWKGRGGKTYKGYFALFICLATKAIHIELVSELTTQAFLAAYKRFTARRGLCKQIHSDCGTNFVGANAELNRMLQNSQHDWKEVADALGNLGTEWRFIPPASPHFGGLWEAGVKSVKYHLRRVIGNEKLTFEELTTFLAQIEACLNSRPLCPLSENMDDLEVITPGHFLVGDSIHNVPQEDSLEKRTSYLDRWKRLQTFVDAFWRKWSVEYLTRLQQRPKWAKIRDAPQVGDLVLVKDERLPPSHWNLARIEETHPGSDGLTRVVTVKTKTGVMKRPITKLCYLPSNKNDTQESLI